MSKNVVYRGGTAGDSRILAGVDLAKAGVEGFEETQFFHGVPVEVSAEVAKALVEEDIFGNFEAVTKEEAKAEAKATDKSENKDAVPGNGTVINQAATETSKPSAPATK